MTHVQLTVNGERREVSCDPGETLLEVLRERLGLRGTKDGCGIGYCGACTVLVDGAAGHSCCLLAATLEGRHITTIEGIGDTTPDDTAPNSAAPWDASPYDTAPDSAATRNASPDDTAPNSAAPRDTAPDDVQQAFLEAGAVQCGYCTPGFVLSVRALLTENPSPDEAEVRRFLAGNICRCSGFAAIVRAALAAGADR